MRSIWPFICLFISIAPTPLWAQDAEPVETAHAKFEAARQQWIDVYKSIQDNELAKAGKSAREMQQIDQQIGQLRADAERVLTELVSAGLSVYKADPISYPDVNQTLFAMADFYVVGDSHGDGGDQYERALPLIRGLLEAGAGEEKPRLWLSGAVSATCLNEFDLAEDYFAKARAAEQLGSNPPESSSGARLWQSATTLESGLSKLKRNWQMEEKIRASEAQADDLPRVKLTTKNGDIVIELFENEAPQAVANFITLVKDGFYDGVPFHRVLPGFMAQGGDPTGTGGGGPGYCIRCECYGPNYRKHFRGSLSMAHAGRDTGGSQFFLTFVPTPGLDGRHTVFGRIVEGMEVAAAIKRRDPQRPSPPSPDKILTATVLRDRGHDYTFEKLPER